MPAKTFTIVRVEDWLERDQMGTAHPCIKVTLQGPAGEVVEVILPQNATLDNVGTAVRNELSRRRGDLLGKQVQVEI